MRASLPVLALLLVLSLPLLSACGLKDDLFLPPPESSPQPVPAPSEQDRRDEEQEPDAAHS